MSDELPQAWAGPNRAKDNSPRIHPWVAVAVGKKSHQGQKKWHATFQAFFRPFGALEIFVHDYPAMNRWAIFGCPRGTKPALQYYEKTSSRRAE
jgi:hypothetical protein